MAKSKEPCKFYRRPKGCDRGQSCTFLHAEVRDYTANTRSSKSSAQPRVRTKIENDFREWTFLIPKDSSSINKTLPDTFFRLAWDLMSKDNIEIGQQIIKKFATEGGLVMIKGLIDDCPDIGDMSSSLSYFKAGIVPFFRTLTHPVVLSSFILEMDRATVWTFLFGPNGRRAVNLFSFIVPILGVMSHDVKDLDQISAIAVATSLLVLEYVVENNQSAQVIPEFASLVNDLTSTVPEKFLASAGQSLNRIRARLSVSETIAQPSQKSGRSMFQTPSFQLEIDLPGELSALGPRHDNDHANISDVKILPTADEIKSGRAEYLPSNDSTKHHHTGLRGLLDRQFRLLREDTVGQVRDAVQVELRRLSDIDRGQPGTSASGKGVRTMVYHNFRICRMILNRQRGLQFIVQVDQPAGVAEMGVKAREEWWNSSKHLQAEAFVCFISSMGNAIFFSVSSIKPPTSKHVKAEDNDSQQPTAPSQDIHARPSLFTDAGRATLVLSLVENRRDDFAYIVNQVVQGPERKQSLVEFPGILLPAFHPTLKALQKMSQALDVPFGEILAPESITKDPVEIPSPAYTLQSGFGFKLETLTGGHPLTMKSGEAFDDTVLRGRTTLDDAQRRSVMGALQKAIALIQGPPGTGKSYTGIAIIKTLLANRNRQPMMCVCYTNHALDQVLSNLVNDGVKQIIRIGSGSKSEALQSLLLNHVSKDLDTTKAERTEVWQLNQDLDPICEELDDLIEDTRFLGSTQWIKEYLLKYHPAHHQQLYSSGVDADGFQEVRDKDHKALKKWLDGTCKDEVTDRPAIDRPATSLLHVRLADMSNSERGLLYQYWFLDKCERHTQRLWDFLTEYWRTTDSLRRCHQERDLRCLAQAHVIGVTTTGLARNIDILTKVRPRAVVLEEAGEVLEAHSLTALLPSIEHAILIGDHEQLRPQINKFEFQASHPLGKKYSFDISLFERLVRPESGRLGVPHSTLEVQRRMHPSIAELVRSTLYPALQDHGSVHEFPMVEGMRKRLFWLGHDKLEDSKSSNTDIQSVSKSNQWEIEMTAALVTHIVRQGVYQEDDVAVLTPYLGQLQKLRKRLKSTMTITLSDRDKDELEAKGLGNDNGEGIAQGDSKLQKTSLINALRIATVDNFQGEEAKVIIISLVRSNEEGKCGFLKTTNRINVLLSRARHGMYIIGNIRTARSVPMWDQVITILEKGGNVGRTLALCCSRHKETDIAVSTPDDFAILSPEGGCNQKCGWRLGCGHACVNRCHSKLLHDAVRCLERCPRLKKGCEHACQLPCGEKCDTLCGVLIADVALPCKHISRSLPCHLAQDPSKAKCEEKVVTTVPACGHKVKVRCHELPLPLSHHCKASCDATLPCGHQCKHQCSTCNVKKTDGTLESPKHKRCVQLCGRSYNACGHYCRAACHGESPCPLCEETCEAECPHSHCGKKCNENCAPCLEKCTWTACAHRQASCTLPCSVPCDRLPCSQRCTSYLDCGHQCPSICSEACPDVKFCQVCGDDSVKELSVCYITGSSYREVDLNRSPCIIPSCGHILTMESMDGVMSMSSHYEVSTVDGINEPIQSTKVSVPFSEASPGPKSNTNCPLCRKPVRNINRYGRIVKRAWIDEATKKFIVWANARFVALNTTVGTFENQLRSSEPVIDLRSQLRKRKTVSAALNDMTLDSILIDGTRDSQIRTILKAQKGDMRYKFVRQLRGEIVDYLEKVNENEQPFSRIYALVEDARRHCGSDTELAMVPTMLQSQSRILATILLLRFDYAVLYRFVKDDTTASKDRSARDCRIDLAINRQDCEGLIIEARTRKQPRSEVEGILYYARFVALERGCTSVLSPADVIGLVDDARTRLKTAKTMCKENPGSAQGLASEVLEAEKMLREATFYEPVTNDERRAVYAAMAMELRGTGHWYYCQNGHPFTIGNCGLPNQEAQCPQCGATVGGTGYRPAEGVTRATDLDATFAGH